MGNPHVLWPQGLGGGPCWAKPLDILGKASPAGRAPTAACPSRLGAPSEPCFPGAVGSRRDWWCGARRPRNLSRQQPAHGDAAPRSAQPRAATWPGRPWWRLQQRSGRLRAAGRLCPRRGSWCPRRALNAGPGRAEGCHPQAGRTATVGHSSAREGAQEQAGPAGCRGWPVRRLRPQTTRGRPTQCPGTQGADGQLPPALPDTRSRRPRVSSPAVCRWPLLVVTRTTGDTRRFAGPRVQAGHGLGACRVTRLRLVWSWPDTQTSVQAEEDGLRGLKGFDAPGPLHPPAAPRGRSTEPVGSGDPACPPAPRGLLMGHAPR